MLPFFTILHPLVDACSETVLVVGGMLLQWVLAYNALAFVLQFPLGVALVHGEGAGDVRAEVTEIQAAKSTAVLGVRFDGKVLG